MAASERINVTLYELSVSCLVMFGVSLHSFFFCFKVLKYVCVVKLCVIINDVKIDNFFAEIKCRILNANYQCTHTESMTTVRFPDNGKETFQFCDTPGTYF